jgi:hypothetical protein
MGGEAESHWTLYICGMAALQRGFSPEGVRSSWSSEDNRRSKERIKLIRKDCGRGCLKGTPFLFTDFVFWLLAIAVVKAFSATPINWDENKEASLVSPSSPTISQLLFKIHQRR